MKWPRQTTAPSKELISPSQPPTTAPSADAAFNFLLACCAESIGHRTNAEPLRWLQQQKDFARVLRLADHHRVLPQVHYCLLSPVDIDISFMKAIRRSFAVNARRSLLLTADLLRIVSHFESLGLPVLAYKGPVLAQLLYQDVTQRQFGDIDLLLRVEDISRAREALINLGYRPKLSLTPAQESAHLASGYELGFTRDQGSNLVELKWRIAPNFFAVDFNIQNLFQRAAKIDLDGRYIATISESDLLLILCVHAAKHEWQQLSLVHDIAQLAMVPTIDWDFIRDETQRMGIQRIVAVNFLLIQSLFGYAFPAPIKLFVERDRKAENPAREFAKQIRMSADHHPETFAYFRQMMQLRERRSDRWRFLWRLTTTATLNDWSTINLSPSLFGLYRVVRLFRILRRFLRVSTESKDVSR